ncbi:MAG: hypothetical protein ABW198_00900 [Pseudorhodoplanes sp.]
MAAFAVALAFATLSGCSTAQIDAMPKALGGLPEGAPRRLENPPDYPAVHDVPPARSKALMDQDEQKRLEADLVATRARLQDKQKNKAKNAPKQAAVDSAAKPANAPTVKRGRRPTALADDDPAPGKRGQAARPAPAAEPSPPAGGNGAAWPAPAPPDATGFGRNP